MNRIRHIRSLAGVLAGLACAWLFLGLAGLTVALWLQGIKSGGGVVYMSRNFYGVLTVYENLF